MKPLTVGTAHAVPGRVSVGTFEGPHLPTGGSDSFPVMIAQGREAGPTLWLTASIHGAEYTGIAVIHSLLTDDLAARMRGAIVAIPTLNPAGLRQGTRTAYYAATLDPNRLFPGVLPRAAGDTPASPLELAYARLFSVIAETGQYLIDLHNFVIGAIPFAFRDPVFYRDSRDRVGAARLQEQVGAMLAAFGHTVIDEYVSADYIRRGLHRSVSGAALNNARIPAFTVELGGYMVVDPAIVSAALAGIRNVLRWAGMLDGAAEPITGIPVIQPGFPVRRILHPYAPDAGVVRYRVRAGDIVTAGEPVALLTDIVGRPLGAAGAGGEIRSDYDGFVLGLVQGAVCYQNDPLLSLAIRDDQSLVLPF